MVFYVFLCGYVCWFLYGAFCHGALKLDISTLFTTFFPLQLFNFILHCEGKQQLASLFLYKLKLTQKVLLSTNKWIWSLYYVGVTVMTIQVTMMLQCMLLEIRYVMDTMLYKLHCPQCETSKSSTSPDRACHSSSRSDKYFILSGKHNIITLKTVCFHIFIITFRPVNKRFLKFRQFINANQL